MKAPYLILAPLLCAFFTAPAPAGADVLPMPSVWRDGERKAYSSADFEKVLRQLKTERSALESEWKALVKRSAAAEARGPSASQLQAELKDLLERLRQERSPAPVAPKELVLGGKKIEPLPAGPAKTIDPPPPVPLPKVDVPTDTIAEPVDSLSEAHALFRARRFAEALTSFRQVDLKGKKAEARAPVQYLMAMCLLHLDKAEEATTLLREVANSHGDEKLAGYAQWQLELLRWQREVQDKLQRDRERRQALEKKL